MEIVVRAIGARRLLLFVAPLLARAARGDSTILPNNLTLHPFPFFENTAKVVPPGPLCPDGTITVSLGQPRVTAILNRPLLDSHGHIDLTATAAEIPYPSGPSQQPATDNQIVRAKDGSLLIFRDSF